VNVRTVIQSIEALGQLADDEDVQTVLRETWAELKDIEKEFLGPNRVDKE
jgi:hypothetical protein